ncbi:MAG: YbbR-like domain-containing protein [Candidatus Krumholzibacteriia bacterium]
MRLPASLRTNPGLKILSVALALLLWSFVHGSKVTEREVGLPIRYVNLPDSLMFVEPPTDEMRVLVSGPAQELFLRLRFMRDVAAVIDLSGAHAAQHRIHPSLSQISPPSNPRVSFVRILWPTTVEFEIARRSVRDIPVRVVLRGDVPEGYCLTDSPHVVPPVITCSGPSYLVDSIDEITTMPVELPHRRGRFSERVDLLYAGQHLECAPEDVQVEFVMERLRNRALPETPLTVVPPAAAELWVDVDTAYVSLTLVGPEPQIEALDPEDVGLFLDASQLQAGRYDSLHVIARFPEWAQLVSLEPATVGVTVHTDDEELPEPAGENSSPPVPEDP